MLRRVLHPLRYLFDQLIWWLVRARSVVEPVQGITFVYTGRREDPKRVLQRRLLAAALDQLRAAPAFQDFVERNLTFVASVDGKLNAIIPTVGVYATSFAPPVATNAMYLACRLVWAAKVMELRRRNSRATDKAISRLAHAEVLRFASSLPDTDEWQDYLRPDDWDF